MPTRFKDLGIYSDLVSAAGKARKLWPPVKPGKKTQQLVLDLLGFDPYPAKPRNVRVETSWERHGVEGELITWTVGYGPRTEAWYLRPSGSRGKKLPGVVALHDHGGFKYLGKEKVAEGPNPLDDLQLDWMSRIYGGRPFANELARRGFAVLVPDTFCWGSRKFPIADITEWDRMVGDALHAKMAMDSNPPKKMSDDVSRYNWSASAHEHTVQKYCNVLGTSMAGLNAFEDRVATNYLVSRKDVQSGGVGCVGLSGGGLRSTLLQATSPSIRAAVVVGLMSTYDGLLDHNVVSHTWMMYPSPSLARQMDWPDLVACRAPSPLMVQYDNEDPLFTLEGMKAADRRIAKHYRSVGKPKNYVGEFYPGPHKFDESMQESAFAWLGKMLSN